MGYMREKPELNKILQVKFTDREILVISLPPSAAGLLAGAVISVSAGFSFGQFLIALITGAFTGIAAGIAAVYIFENRLLKTIKNKTENPEAGSAEGNERLLISGLFKGGFSAETGRKKEACIDPAVFDEIIEKFDEISRNNGELLKSVKAASDDAAFNADKLKKVNGITKSVTGAITIIIEDIKKINDRASSIVKLAKTGSSVTGSEIQAMSSIKTAVTESTVVIEKLRTSSKQIKGIVNTVAEIAKKTNMLSLNAGIEAARAGEAGKSFAVVAQEIRSLAEGATKATKEISDFLQRTEELALQAVNVISEQNKVEDAVNVVYSASDSFLRIVESLGEISRMLANIYAAVEEHKIDNDLLGVLSGNMNDKLGGLTSSIYSVSEKMKSNIIITEEIKSEVAALKNIGEAD